MNGCHDNCDINAYCSDSGSPYTCICNNGYIGNGTKCTGILITFLIYRVGQKFTDKLFIYGKEILNKYIIILLLALSQIKYVSIFQYVLL